jgi:hypothetical protein
MIVGAIRARGSVAGRIAHNAFHEETKARSSGISKLKQLVSFVAVMMIDRQ